MSAEHRVSAKNRRRARVAGYAFGSLVSLASFGIGLEDSQNEGARRNHEALITASSIVQPVDEQALNDAERAKAVYLASIDEQVAEQIRDVPLLGETTVFQHRQDVREAYQTIDQHRRHSAELLKAQNDNGATFRNNRNAGLMVSGSVGLVLLAGSAVMRLLGSNVPRNRTERSFALTRS